MKAQKMDIDRKKLFGKQNAFASVVKEISPNDGMAKGSPEQYFVMGANAASLISQSLSSARKPVSEVQRILDYACGYGRVLRWLKAEYPNAYLLGVDADQKAAASAQQFLGVETRKLDITLSAPIDDPFDLIWVGSLFTHLPEDESKRILAYLRRHLRQDGVLVFTTHGPYVARRIRTRDKIYNLNNEAIERLLDGYTARGFGFAAYKNAKEYGITVATPAKMCQLLQECDLEIKLYLARGWGAHHDVYACVPFDK